MIVIHLSNVRTNPVEPQAQPLTQMSGDFSQMQEDNSRRSLQGFSVSSRGFLGEMTICLYTYEYQKLTTL